MAEHQKDKSYEINTYFEHRLLHVEVAIDDIKKALDRLNSKLERFESKIDSRLEKFNDKKWDNVFFIISTFAISIFFWRFFFWIVSK